jgi:predicted O-methyltransferase YrrM
MQQAEQAAGALLPEYHRATPECPHPERWSMYDSMTAEYEVLEFLRTLVTTLKPDLVVETGSFLGASTLWIAEGLERNGFGRVLSCEFDPVVFAKAQEKIAGSPLRSRIELRNESSLEMDVHGTIDLLFSDSDMPVREQEVMRFLPQMNPNGLILMHDASSHLKVVREAALSLERKGLLSVVLLPTPRGLVVAQPRQRTS